jgi:hypothetical protein
MSRNREQDDDVMRAALTRIVHTCAQREFFAGQRGAHGRDGQCGLRILENRSAVHDELDDIGADHGDIGRSDGRLKREGGPALHRVGNRKRQLHASLTAGRYIADRCARLAK